MLTYADAVSELASSMVGERYEMRTASASATSMDEEEEEEQAPDPFSTSSLVRSAEVISLHLYPLVSSRILTYAHVC
jgi:hypothetical protein